MKHLLHSVCLRLIHGLERIRDQVSEDSVEVLRESEIHAQSSADNRLQSPAFYPRTGEGDMDLTAELAGVDQQIRAGQDYLARLHDDPSVRAYLEGLSRSRNYSDLIDQFNASQIQSMTSGEIMRLYGDRLKPVPEPSKEGAQG